MGSSLQINLVDRWPTFVIFVSFVVKGFQVLDSGFRRNDVEGRDDEEPDTLGHTRPPTPGYQRVDGPVTRARQPSSLSATPCQVAVPLQHTPATLSPPLLLLGEDSKNPLTNVAYLVTIVSVFATL